MQKYHVAFLIQNKYKLTTAAVIHLLQCKFREVGQLRPGKTHWIYFKAAEVIVHSHTRLEFLLLSLLRVSHLRGFVTSLVLGSSSIFWPAAEVCLFLASYWALNLLSLSSEGNSLAWAQLKILVKVLHRKHFVHKYYWNSEYHEVK